MLGFCCYSWWNVKLSHPPDVDREVYSTNLEDGMREVLSDELLNWLQLSAHSQLQSVPVSVATLELLRCPEATERPVDHDTHSRTQGLTLSHAVGGEEDRLTSAGNTSDDRPQELTGHGIHPGGGLVLGYMGYGVWSG